MTTALMYLILAAPNSTLGHGIYGGFALRWVPQQNQVAQVAISSGAAIIDGNQVTTSVAPAFPNDSPAVTPLAPTIVPTPWDSYAAYCYVLDLGARTSVNSWFSPSGNTDAFDFDCYVGSAYSPSPDGHPAWDGGTDGGLPYSYPLSDGGIADLYVSDAIFVGSVIVTQVDAGTLYYGNPAGLSVVPFYRNGSQAIYATASTCAALKCVQSGWDLGIPNQQIIASYGGVCPAVLDVDFTADGVSDVFPLSASQVIFDFEGYSHDGITNTVCFMDPNVQVWGANQQRSCQSEVQLDPEFGAWQPIHPFRAAENVSVSTALPPAGGYGEAWLGLACNNGSAGKGYFDLSYRGYVEPERQMLPQVR